MDIKVTSILITLILFLGIQAKELFHFNFKDANGKKEIKSNGFVLKSHRVPLLVQNKALRLAATAVIEIKGNLPDFRKGFAISSWVLRKREIDICPILSSGMYRSNQAFVFCAGGDFFTRNSAYQVSGIKKGNAIRKSGIWEHTVAVYSNGKYTFYKDGKLFAQANGKMLAGSGPLYVGAEKEINKVMNFANADMLLNDLRFFDAPLSLDDVANLYTLERKNYPTGSLIPKGKTSRHALELCFHYTPKGYDPDLKTPIYPLPKKSKPEPLKDAFIKSKGSDTAPLLYINGKEHFPYMAYFLKNINHDRYEPEQGGRAAADFAGAGVDLVRVSMGGDGHPYCGWTWFGEGKYNFKVADELIGNIIKNNPHAKLQIMFHPGISAPWFRTKYPKELESLMLPNGTIYTPLAGSLLNSDVWKRCKGRFLKDLIEHLENGPYADRIYGYNIGGGASAEWYWPGTFSSGTPGYSTATQKIFSQWLTKRYGNDKALQKAWNDSKVTLDTAQVPLPKEREYSETLTLRDPPKAAKVLDLRRFFNDRVFEMQEYFLKIAKKYTKNKKLVGTYSGYAFGNQPKHHKTGMNAAGRLLRLAECDFTQLAIGYGDIRKVGASGLCVNPFNGSAMLHGKLLWNEADLRTPYTLNTDAYENANRHNTMQDTANVIIRNFGNALTRNSGIYEMLLTGHETYHHKTIMDAVSQMNKIATKNVGKTRRSVAEIAVIHDEHSADYFAWPNSKNTRFFNALMHQFYYESPRTGIPMDFYLMDDIADLRMKDYKLYIFLTAIEVPLKMRQAIHKKIAKNNATAVWFFAPGFIENGRFSIQGMEKLTGIKFDVSLKTEKLKVMPTKNSKLLSRNLGLPEMYYGPVPTPISKGQIVHGTAKGKPAVVEVNTSLGKAFYSLLPPNVEMIRNLAKISNLHIYSHSRDIFNINSTHIMFHATTAGKKTILLPTKHNIYDAVTGKKLFSNVTSFTVNMKQFESRIWAIEKL